MHVGVSLLSGTQIFAKIYIWNCRKTYPFFKIVFFKYSQYLYSKIVFANISRRCSNPKINLKISLQKFILIIFFQPKDLFRNFIPRIYYLFGNFVQKMYPKYLFQVFCPKIYSWVFIPDVPSLESIKIIFSNWKVTFLISQSHEIVLS